MDSIEDNVIGDAVGQDTPKMPDMKDFKMPTQEELLSILSKLDIPDADKDEIKKNLLSGELLKTFDPSKAQQQYGDSARILVFIACVLVMVLVFVFFGYKLYRSQTEKERKREEKRKQKQQKKKQK